MEPKELISKLKQIEEQAKDTLAEFPALTKERLRMIIALARYLRTEVSLSMAREDSGAPPLAPREDDRLADSG